MILSRLGNSPNMFCSEFARRQQPYKLSATGQELGSSMLFSSRIGCWNTANAALDVVPHVPWHGLGLHGWEICRQPVNRRFLWHPVFTLARRLGRMPFWSWERRPTLWFWNSIKQHFEVARVQNAKPDSLTDSCQELLLKLSQSVFPLAWPGEILSVLSDEQHVVPPLIHLDSDWSPESILMLCGKAEDVTVGIGGYPSGALQVLGAWYLALFRLACPEHIFASLRNMVAKSTDPLYHCLIDTGALVMGFTNEEVAKLLLKLLPEDLFEPWWAKSIKICKILGQPHCIPTQAGQDQFQILCLCVIRMALPILMIATLQWWFCGMLWNQSLGIDLQTRADGTVQRMCGT